MAATPSLKVVKSMPYRGGTKVWSNRYHFNGGVPADGTAWTTFADAVVAAEKLQYPSPVTIIEAVGYGAGSDLPIWSKVYTTAGTAIGLSTWKAQGASAALVRYSTTARSAKNHPIYLFNYVHAVHPDDTGDGDRVDPAQKTLLEAYASAWLAGFSDGTHTLVRAGPNGATATSRIVNGELTHRDFPD